MAASAAAFADAAQNADLLDGLDSSTFAKVTDLQATDASLAEVTSVLCQAIQRMAGNPSLEALALCGDQVFKFVFATSTLHNGDLKTAGQGATGLEGADNICNARARAAGLRGTYTAWLSDSVTDAADRVTHSSVPYRLPTGLLVANDFEDLTDCTNPTCLQTAIVIDEFGRSAGAHQTGSRVAWTNTATDGSKTSSSCNDWTDVGGIGVWGIIDFPYESWTVWNQSPCTGELHLYCFQD